MPSVVGGDPSCPRQGSNIGGVCLSQTVSFLYPQSDPEENALSDCQSDPGRNLTEIITLDNQTTQTALLVSSLSLIASSSDVMARPDQTRPDQILIPVKTVERRYSWPISCVRSEAVRLERSDKV